MLYIIYKISFEKKLKHYYVYSHHIRITFEDKLSFFEFKKDIYAFEVFVGSEPFYYYVAVLKNDFVLSWDVTMQIVRTNGYFGLQLSSCKFNQIIEKSIYIDFIKHFCDKLLVDSDEKDLCMKSYFHHKISFYYYCQVILKSDKNFRKDDEYELAFIKGLFNLAMIYY